MPGRLDFTFNFPKPTGARAAEDDEVPIFRIGWIADFGGTAHREGPWTFRRIDVDRFDAEFRRLAPGVKVSIGGASPLEIDLAFSSLDDFHPDALLSRSALLARLAALRAEAADPARFPAPGPSPSLPDAPPSGSDFERLLGGKPEGAPAAGPDLRGFFRDLVAEHVVPAAGPAQRDAQRAIDEGLAALLRAVLHDPAFRRIETAWRCLHRVAAELTGGPEIEIHLLDRGEAEWRADLAADATRLSAALDAAGGRFDAILLDAAFGPSEEDRAALAGLARVAAPRGAVVVAGAAPSLGEADAPAAWTAFRRAPEARSIALALPRLLARLPYGAKTDAVEAFPFEEWTAEQSPDEAYAWSNAGWAVARGLALAHLERCGEPAGDPLEVDDLPAHNVVLDGEPRRTPPAERILTEAAVAQRTANGLVVVQSHARRDAARLSGLYPVAL